MEESIRDKITRIRKLRYDLENDEVLSLSDDLSGTDDFKALCLELAEEAVERELQAEAIAARIKELQDRKARVEHTAETLRSLVLQCMVTRNETTIPSPAITLSVSTLKPSVIVTDESAIPSRFFKPQDPKLDKAALKDAVLNDGEVIEGVARDNGKVTLTIRRK